MRNELKICVVSVLGLRDLRKCFTLEDGSFYCFLMIDIVLLVLSLLSSTFNKRDKSERA